MTNAEKTRLQKEIVDSVDQGASGRLLLAPRVGKSRIAIMLTKKNKPKSILWVTPSAKLATEDIPQEFEKWKAKSYLKKLTTVTWMSLDKIDGHFDMIILDEEQFVTENNTKNFFNDKLTYDTLISMTGTPTKHAEKQLIYKKLKLSVLYDMSINEAVDIGLLSNYSIKVLEVDMSTAKTLEAGSKAKRFMTSEASNYQYLTKMVNQAMYQGRADAKFRILNRLRAIKNSPSKLEAAQELLARIDGRVLIFAGTINQANHLCDAHYHSKTKDTALKHFQAGDIDRIAMVNAGGTGFTYKELDHLVMVQADSDKNGLTSQKIARTLLKQKNYNATVWIVSLIGTQDEKWVASALENFDKDKVEYIRYKNFKR